MIDEAESGKQNGRLVSVRIDDVEMPLGFGQLQAATLVGWPGNVEDEEFQLLIRRLQGLDSVRTAQPQSRWASASATGRFADGVGSARLARRHPSAKPTMLLAAVFLANYIQTSVDAALTPRSLGAEAGYPIADAFQWFEGYLSFELHDTTGAIASYGYSASYS